ncbi:MAG: hypothetical protein AAB421_00860 [Patescibacteria group bacterium]
MDSTILEKLTSLEESFSGAPNQHTLMSEILKALAPSHPLLEKALREPEFRIASLIEPFVGPSESMKPSRSRTHMQYLWEIATTKPEIRSLSSLVHTRRDPVGHFFEEPGNMIPHFAVIMFVTPWLSAFILPWLVPTFQDARLVGMTLAIFFSTWAGIVYILNEFHVVAGHQESVLRAHNEATALDTLIARYR